MEKQVFEKTHTQYDIYSHTHVHMQCCERVFIANNKEDPRLATADLHTSISYRVQMTGAEQKKLRASCCAG